MTFEARLHQIIEDNRKARIAAAGRISRLAEVLQTAETPEAFTESITDLLNDPLGNGGEVFRPDGPDQPMERNSGDAAHGSGTGLAP